MSLDREQLREQGCVSSPVELDGWVLMRQDDILKLRSDRCAVWEGPFPEELYPPAAPAPVVAPDVEIPPALIIGNPPLTVTCNDIFDSPTVLGDPVTVEESRFTQAFSWTSIPDLKADRLTYISGLTEAERLQAVTFSEQEFNLVKDQMKEQYKLTTPQAEFVHTTLGEIRELVEEIALNFVLSQLECFWENTPQEVECPPGTVSLASTLVPAGTYTSTISQEEADLIALTAAESLLRCGFLNDEVTAVCEDLGFEESVPNNSSTGQLGSYTVAAGVYSSLISLEDANNQAQLFAQSQLNCFYLSEPVEADCLSRVEDPTGLLYGPGVVGPDLSARGPYNQVTGLAGLITSTISTADATEQAQAYIESLIECIFENEEQIAECPEVPEDSVNVEFNPDASTDLVVVQAGDFISTVSQAEANEQALLFATAQLQCLYCNTEIAPDCTDDYNSARSLDETIGLIENSFCSTDPTTVEEVSPALAALPPSRDSGTVGCRYGNFKVVAGCNQAAVLSSTAYEDGDDIVAAFPDDEAGLTGGSLSQIVVIPANTVFIGDTEVAPENPQTVAQNLARDLASSQLNCLFENEPVLAGCTRPHLEIEDAKDNIELDFYRDPPNVLVRDDLMGASGSGSGSGSDPESDPESEAGQVKLNLEQSNTPIEVKAGKFLSSVSQEDATEQARAFAEAQLECLYCNTAIVAECTTDYNGVSSIDETIGLIERGFCSTDPSTVQQVSPALAALPPPRDESTDDTDTDEEVTIGCRYGNFKVVAGCNEAAVLASDVYEVGDDIVAAFPDDEPGLTDGSKELIIVIPANTVFVGDAEVAPQNPQTVAQDLARDIARSQLICQFCNEEITVNCSDLFPDFDPFVCVNYLADTLDQREWAGKGFSIFGASLRFRSFAQQEAVDEGSTDPDETGGSGLVDIPESLSEGYAAVRALISSTGGVFGSPSQPGCDSVAYYARGPSYPVNAGISSSVPVKASFNVGYTDPDAPGAVNEVTVEACDYISDINQEEANKTARAAAIAQLVCLWQNDEIQGGYIVGSGGGGSPNIFDICESGVAFKNPGVAQGTVVTAGGKTAANNTAGDLAEALVSCQAPEDEAPAFPPFPSLPCTTITVRYPEEGNTPVDALSETTRSVPGTPDAEKWYEWVWTWELTQAPQDDGGQFYWYATGEPDISGLIEFEEDETSAPRIQYDRTNGTLDVYFLLRDDRIMIPDGWQERPTDCTMVWYDELGGGGGVTGFTIYLDGETRMTHIPLESAMFGYIPDPADPGYTPNWYLKFDTNSSGTAIENVAPVGGYDPATDALYDGDATADPAEAQTFYRIPLVLDDIVVSEGGVYRQNYIVDSTGPKVELLRIG